MPVNGDGKPCGRGSAGVKVAGRRFALYKEPVPEAPPLILPALSLRTVDALFVQAIATHPQTTGGRWGEREKAVMEEFAELIRAEHNWWLAHRREGRGGPETSHTAHTA